MTFDFDATLTEVPLVAPVLGPPGEAFAAAAVTSVGSVAWRTASARRHRTTSRETDTEAR